MKEKRLFNIFGDDSLQHRQVVGGNVNKLVILNNVKYTWAKKL